MTFQSKSCLLKIPLFIDYCCTVLRYIYPPRLKKIFLVVTNGAHVCTCVHKWRGVRICKCVCVCLSGKGGDTMFSNIQLNSSLLGLPSFHHRILGIGVLALSELADDQKVFTCKIFSLGL